MVDKKLTATPDMRAAVQALINAKRISASTYEYARSQGYEDADVIRLAEEQRAIKARMALNGSPALYRPKKGPESANGPNEHRAQKSEGWRKGHASKELGAPTVYKERTVLDQYGDKYEVEFRLALTRFLQDAQYSERVRVADLAPAGGGVPGKRLGGLGNVPDSVRLAHARHQWILPHLSIEARTTASALITHELRRPNNVPFSMEEFGAHAMPAVIDKNRRWGVSAGALWLLGGQLVHLYARCPYRLAWEYESDDTNADLEM